MAPAVVATVAEAIDEVLDAGAETIVVDATKLRFCDSSGIQVLIQARERVPVTLVGAQGSVEKVLAVTGLLELFTQEQ